MYEFPTDPKKISERIRRYERTLEKERQKHGFYRDGYGKRLLLGPLYLLLGNNDDTLRHYQWYQQEFPDQSAEPFQYFCWTIALYRHGDTEAAANKLIQTMLSNLYLIPYILGNKRVFMRIFRKTHSEEKYSKFKVILIRLLMLEGLNYVF